MRLITFGDSNTYGQALPDCYWDKPGLIGPSKFAWPQLLADKLGMECHNAGIPGSANKLIMHQLMSFPLLPSDTVVVLWSFPERYCHLNNLVTDYKDWKTIRHLAIAPWVKTVSSRNYYKHVYKELDQQIMSNHYISYTNLYLEQQGIANYHTSVVDSTHPLIFNIDYLRLRHEYPRALDGEHIGLEAHVELAKLIYERIAL